MDSFFTPAPLDVYKRQTNNKDAWIVAYNSDYIVCVWMGFDKTDDGHSLEKGVTGGTYPAAFASAFFSAVYPVPSAAPSFSAPPTIEQVEIDGRLLKEETRLCPVSYTHLAVYKRQVLLQLKGHHNFPQFSADGLTRSKRCVFDKLLGNGAGSLNDAPAFDVLQKSAADADGVNTVMRVKSRVFNGHKGIFCMLRNRGKGRITPTLAV